jgi:hypothetical protein
MTNDLLLRGDSGIRKTTKRAWSNQALFCSHMYEKAVCQAPSIIHGVKGLHARNLGPTYKVPHSTSPAYTREKVLSCPLGLDIGNSTHDISYPCIPQGISPKCGASAEIKP